MFFAGVLVWLKLWELGHSHGLLQVAHFLRGASTTSLVELPATHLARETVVSLALYFLFSHLHSFISIIVRNQWRFLHIRPKGFWILYGRWGCIFPIICFLFEGPLISATKQIKDSPPFLLAEQEKDKIPDLYKEHGRQIHSFLDKVHRYNPVPKRDYCRKMRYPPILPVPTIQGENPPRLLPVKGKQYNKEFHHYADIHIAWGARSTNGAGATFKDVIQGRTNGSFVSFKEAVEWRSSRVAEYNNILVHVLWTKWSKLHLWRLIQMDLWFRSFKEAVRWRSLRFAKRNNIFDLDEMEQVPSIEINNL